MLVQIASDLHLSFGDIELPVAKDKKGREATTLILAGDISDESRIPYEDWMFLICKNYENVLFVTGNHEYYMREIDEVDRQWRQFEKDVDNFTFLQKNVVEIEGKRIAGCTLWTSMEDVDWYNGQNIRRGMSDFHIIKKRGSRFSIDICKGLHQDHKRWLNKQEDIDIVVTHHAPSWQSVVKFWEGHFLNPAFASHDDDTIRKLSPKFWVHGHMHSFIRYWHDGIVNGTQVLCNPRGYSGKYQEQTGFRNSLLVEI